MDTAKLGLKKGNWLLANCGKYPSEKNCQMVFMAPSSQRDELLTAIVEHATSCHAHKDSSELRKELNQFIEQVEVN